MFKSTGAAQAVARHIERAQLIGDVTMVESARVNHDLGVNGLNGIPHKPTPQLAHAAARAGSALSLGILAARGTSGTSDRTTASPAATRIPGLQSPFAGIRCRP
ncbi:hypothetical protein GCM10010402_19830 [Actinomadura luteofluorescens]